MKDQPVSYSSALDPCRGPHGNNLGAALDFVRFDAIAEAADLAGELTGVIVEAADRGEGLRVRAYAVMLARAARNLLEITAELGATDQPNVAQSRARTLENA